jgi:hypothetical protein
MLGDDVPVSLLLLGANICWLQNTAHLSKMGALLSFSTNWLMIPEDSLPSIHHIPTPLAASMPRKRTQATMMAPETIPKMTCVLIPL